MISPKEASAALTRLAHLTETRGEIPVGDVLTLVAQLDGQDRTASRVDAQEAAAFFRNASRLVMMDRNRGKLARVLRKMAAEALDQVAGAGEEFQKHNPKIDDEEAAKIDEMHEKHKDKLKNSSLIIQKLAALPLNDAKFEQVLDFVENTVGSMRRQVNGFGGIEPAVMQGHSRTLKEQIHEISNVLRVLERRL